MLDLFFAVGSSAAPLILCMPPLRNLNLFIASIGDLWRESIDYTDRMYPAFRYLCSRVLDYMLCNSTR